MFKDEADIYAKAGDGGKGCISFRREKYIPKGGPNGGDGGKGGDVIIQTIPNSKTLLDLVRKRTYRAHNGAHGMGSDCAGKSGAPLIIRVPMGTLVKDDQGKLIVDLKEANHQILIAKGGRGGRGNAHFARPDYQTPRIAEDGEAGEEKHIFLELKLIADVGLVGFPNAGKSTLLSRISAARPKIAPYPFTTLEPNLGIVEMSHYRRYVIADLPGLLEGAHQGVGLGYKFLRHIERTRVLVYLLDIVPMDNQSPTSAFHILQRELQCYSPILAQKPYLVVGNKMDITGSDTNLKTLQQELQMPICPISAVTGQGIAEFLEAVSALVERSPKSVEQEIEG